MPNRCLAKLTPLCKRGGRGDLGFRAFKLDSSNFKIWRSDKAPQSAEQLAEQLSLYVDNVLDGRNDQDRLYELILKCGMPLSAHRVCHIRRQPADLPGTTPRPRHAARAVCPQAPNGAVPRYRVWRQRCAENQHRAGSADARDYLQNGVGEISCLNHLHVLRPRCRSPISTGGGCFLW